MNSSPSLLFDPVEPKTSRRPARLGFTDRHLAAARARIQREFQSLCLQQPRLVQLALDEAEALAWQSGWAHLVFPQLALEKIQSLSAWQARQQIMRRSDASRSFAA